MQITSPGFPDENGNDIDDRLEQAPCVTECIENVQLPLPGPLPDELAHTGTDPSILLVLVIALVAILAGLGLRRTGGAS